MKIMTGTVLFTLLMMPAAVIADVTHKVSGNVTITKYQEGDTFSLSWNTYLNGKGTVMVEEILEVEGNGTIPFEMSCDPNQSQSNVKEYLDAGNPHYTACESQAGLRLIRNGMNEIDATHLGISFE